MRDSKLYAQTTADMVYHQLRNQIFSKKRQAGERLPEVSLAKQLDVSRTPVREALRRLANEGLVDLIPNVGARLAAPTRREIADTYEVREYLECLAIRKAAERITPLQICQLQELIDQEELVFAKKDLESYIDVNNAFHRLLAESSGNQVLADYIENVLARTYVYMVFYESFFDIQTNPSLDEHRGLLKALKNHDAASAERLMKAHLKVSATALKNPGEADDSSFL